MAHELMYTSVQKGLKPGSTGFCTVALTGGMPGPMSQRMESLSGYAPVFPLGSPNADENPPVFAHWRVNIGGFTYSVLSHICFAGADYSGRSNKFAHHVLLDTKEQVSAGPAWVIMQPGAMKREWTGEPRTLAPRQLTTNGSNPIRVCETWAKVAGDAGWAGVLAEAFLLDASKPVYVIYNHPGSLLLLINEAISLLPTRFRWRVTFNTYFTKQRAGLPCCWRFCMAGSDAAGAAPANATSGVLLDLTARTPLPPDRESKYVQMARSGRALSAEEDRVPSDEMIAPPSTLRAAGRRTSARAAPPQERLAGSRPTYNLSDAPATTAGPPAYVGSGRGRLDDGRSPSRFPDTVVWMMAVLLLVIVLAVGWLIWDRTATMTQVREDVSATIARVDEMAERLRGLEPPARPVARDTSEHEWDNGGEYQQANTQEAPTAVASAKEPDENGETVGLEKPADGSDGTAGEQNDQNGEEPIEPAEVGEPEGSVEPKPNYVRPEGAFLPLPKPEWDSFEEQVSAPVDRWATELPAGAERINIVLPVQDSRPFSVSQEGRGVIIEYDHPDQGRSVIARVTMEPDNQSIVWEWETRTVISSDKRRLDKLLRFSALVVSGAGGEELDRLQFYKTPQPFKLKIGETLKLDPELWADCDPVLLLEDSGGWKKDEEKSGNTKLRMTNEQLPRGEQGRGERKKTPRGFELHLLPPDRGENPPIFRLSSSWDTEVDFIGLEQEVHDLQEKIDDLDKSIKKQEAVEADKKKRIERIQGAIKNAKTNKQRSKLDSNRNKLNEELSLIGDKLNELKPKLRRARADLDKKNDNKDKVDEKLKDIEDCEVHVVARRSDAILAKIQVVKR